MIRVLHVVGKMNVAGAETMLMNYYKHINRRKIQFDFLYFSNERCDYDNEIENLGGRIYRAPAGYISQFFYVKKIIKDNPEIKAVHCHTQFSSALYLLFSWLIRVPVRVIHSHSQMQKSAKNKAAYHVRLRRNFAKVLINILSNRKIACGEAAADFLFYSKKNVVLIQNAINAKLFFAEALEQGHKLREYLKIKNKSILLIQIGRFAEVKNHNFSLLLLKRLLELGVESHILFAGDGPLKATTEEKSKELKISRWVSFLGTRRDIPALLGCADVLLLPSYYEGFPVTLVESQACALPSIVSDSISREVDLGLGLVEFLPIDARSVDKWADKVINIKSMGKKPIPNIESFFESKGFDVEANAKAMEAVYSQI